MSMNAASCWQSPAIISSKILRTSSLPVGFCSENATISRSASINCKPIRRSRSASFTCELLGDSSVKSSFKIQLVESRDYLKGSYQNWRCAINSGTKVRHSPYISPTVGNRDARKMFWHSSITGSPRENGVDMGAGLCRASFGDSWDETFGGRVEDVALECYSNEKYLEDETPVSCVKVASEVSFGTLYCNENSVVHNDLRTSLGSLYLSGRPCGGMGGPKSHNLEGFCMEQKVFSNVRGLQKDIFKGENRPVQVADAVKMPLSLRILKRRQQEQAKVLGNTGTNVEGKMMGVGESFKNAFSSMVFMIQILQSHTLHIRQLLFCGDVQEFVDMVHREMHLSLVWLFQQVFSCTPKLMLLVMVLLTDFTVFSIGNNLALPNSTPSAFPSTSVSVLCDELRSPQVGSVVQFVGRSEGRPKVYLQNLSEFSSPLIKGRFSLSDADNRGTGSGGIKPLKVAGGEDADAWSEQDTPSRAICSEDDSVPIYTSSLSDTSIEIADQQGFVVEDLSSHSSKMDDDDLETNKFHLLHFLWKEASEELVSIAGEFRNAVALDQQTMERLVAPVSVQLEPDNYICYDQTDLIYQYAITADCKNPMLLANYAQFLYLVRHDYNRAEEFFRRAMKADPVDGEVIGRFATFLWLARSDRAAAERAYKAAIAADPNNPFHTGSYAHFLWHSGEEDVPWSTRPLA